MAIIPHQFQDKSFYDPIWKIKHLFIGTFNPGGGQPVNYYYAREMNQTWRLLSSIFKVDFQPKSSDFFTLIEREGIACLDLIHEVEAPKEKLDFITGKGYSDNAIINGIVKRSYNTSTILNVIERNPGVNIYSTWGKGSKLKEWIGESSKLTDIIPLVSPSLLARVPKGAKKFEYMLDDWRRKVIPY